MATLAAPSVPPAPPTFSMTIVAFSGPRSASARSRATLSVGPPAAKGTMIVTGFSGYSASAAEVAANAMVANRNFFMGTTSG